MKRRILLFIMTLAIIGIIVYANLSSKIEYNDELTAGNTPGNLMNNGYFCENGDTIYFSNANDFDKLYTMNLDCTHFKRLTKTAVSDINCAGKYIYYASRNNKFNKKDKASSADSAGTVLSSGGVGLFRCNRNGSHTATLYDNTIGNVSLSGNYLYYQHYDKTHGLWLYKVKIDEKEGACLFKSAISPVGMNNGSMYYSGITKDHNIYKMSLRDDSYDMFYQGNASHVLAFHNHIYFLDLDNNYALTRVNLEGKEPEVLVKNRVITYNFSRDGKYMYYQIDNKEDSRICQMNLETKEEHVLLKGNFCDINVTSNYVFFKEFDSENVYIIAVEDSPKLNMFDPPILK